MPTASSCSCAPAALVVELCKRYYGGEDASVLPRSIANFKAFENAMTLDIAMGGSTNTILHLLAAAQEAEMDFDLRDIDRLSRKVPQLCKVAPNIQKYHMEDVHRAGGIFGILGELARGGLLHTRRAHRAQPHAWPRPSRKWDITQTNDEAVHNFFKAGPGGHPTQTAFSQSTRWETLDVDREQRLHPRRRTRVFAGRRPGRAVRQHRPGRLRGENRGRG